MFQIWVLPGIRDVAVERPRAADSTDTALRLLTKRRVRPGLSQQLPLSGLWV